MKHLRISAQQGSAWGVGDRAEPQFCAHILDAALGLKPDSSVSTLERKRQNSLRVKKELMKQLQDAVLEPAHREWDDLALAISPEVQQQMEERLIAAADLREAIWTAEDSGDVFVDESAGTRLASLVKPVITYWVEYRGLGGKRYEVLSAYYHRMRFHQEE